MEAEYWKDRKSWPFVTPGFTFLPDAFEAVGRAMFQAQWTGIEATYSDHGPRVPSPHDVFVGDTDEQRDYGLYDKFRLSVVAMLRLPDSGARPTWQQWCDACDRWQHFETYGRHYRERREQVVRAMHEAAALGNLAFSARLEGSGKMEPVEKRLWNCNRSIVDARFERCAINLDSPLQSPPAPTPPSTYDPSKHEAKMRTEGRLQEMVYWSGYSSPLFVETAHLARAADQIGSIHRGQAAEDAGEVVVSDVRCPPALPAPEVVDQDAPKRTFGTKAQSEAWYRERVETAKAAGLRHTRDDDLKAGRAVGIGRARIRELRNLIVPEWTKGGRPTDG